MTTCIYNSKTHKSIPKHLRRLTRSHPSGAPFDIGAPRSPPPSPRHPMPIWLKKHNKSDPVSTLEIVGRYSRIGAKLQRWLHQVESAKENNSIMIIDCYIKSISKFFIETIDTLVVVKF